MYTETEGIILKQIKIAGGRKMLLIFSEKFGKISAGTSISEKGKNKNSLAVRPFTKGRYELYKNKDSYNVVSAETKESYYAIGENVDKYLAASYVLELCEKMLPEDEPAPGMYRILSDFLGMLQKRKSDFDTLVIGFQIKALVCLGLSLSQNPLLSEQSNDKINVVRFIEQHPLTSLEGISIPEESAAALSTFIKQYIFDNLGIANLKSEGLRI